MSSITTVISSMYQSCSGEKKEESGPRMRWVKYKKKDLDDLDFSMTDSRTCFQYIINQEINMSI